MPDEYEVLITDQAEGHLREISHYVAVMLQSPAKAMQLLDLFEKSIASLSLSPKRASLVDSEPWHGYGIRKLPVKNFLVYFWVNDETNEVHVTAVIYARRDQIQQLLQIDWSNI